MDQSVSNELNNLYKSGCDIKKLVFEIWIAIANCVRQRSSIQSTEFEKFMKVYGIKHIRTAPYHPSSNGTEERVEEVLKMAIKASR